jgi:molybdopterin synthase sulfur carrier subunit
MAITVRIPTPLRRVTDGQDKVDTEGETLKQIIDSMESQYPGIKERLCDGDGNLRNFVNVYVNGEDVRFLDGVDSETGDGDEISIVPAVAGGA